MGSTIPPISKDS